MADKERSALTALLMTAGFIAFIVAGAVFMVRHFDLHFSLADLLRRPPTKAPRDPSKDLPIFRGTDETIDPSQMARLRQWLEQSRFDELNAALERYQQAFESDYAREFALYDAYQAFYVTHPEYEILFEDWIRSHPEQYQPYLAAAHYHCAKAWESRGFKWRKNTTDKQIRGMRHHFSVAQKKLVAALEIDPNLMLAYNLLIGIHNAEGEDQAEKEAIDKAISLFPYSYTLRSTALWACEPRWGGSYWQMHVLANQAEPYAREYPVLTALYGAAFYDQARVYERNEDPDKALAAINKAIAFGDRCQFYAERAEIYAFKFKDFEQATADINQAVAIRPTMSSNYLTRAKIYFAQEAYEEALETLKVIDTIQPQNPNTLQWCRWAARKLKKRGHRLFKTDIDATIGFYKKSLAFDQAEADTYYWLGAASYETAHYVEAASNFEDCIARDAHHFKAYRMLDHTLARERRWEEILQHWNAFLELEPDHAEAYFERSGTHYHNGDMRSAKADLQKACELGHQKACQQYEKVKNQY